MQKDWVLKIVPERWFLDFRFHLQENRYVTACTLHLISHLIYTLALDYVQCNVYLFVQLLNI